LKEIRAAVTLNSPEPIQHISLSAKSRVGMISDLHLTPDRDDISQRLQQFLEKQGSELDYLFILGDLFEFWIGDDATVACHYENIEAILTDFVKQNETVIYLMHGNRDFLLGAGFCQRQQSHLINDPCLLKIGSIEIILAHGDAYCTDDTEHQIFRRQTRNPVWQTEFLSLSVDERLEYARQVRAHSEAGKSAKSQLIMDVNQLAIEQEFANFKSSFLIHGHTHRPAVHSLQTAYRRCLRIVLGDWFEQSSYLEINDMLLSFNVGQQQYRINLSDKVISIQ
jgi:UDP-2,3-diacylglucosamine hydrolase